MDSEKLILAGFMKINNGKMIGIYILAENLFQNQWKYMVSIANVHII